MSRVVSAQLLKQSTVTPHAPAIEHGSQVYSYSELIESSVSVARALSIELPADCPAVPVVIDKGFDLVVTALALLHLGIGYAPIDAATPDVEIDRRVREIGARAYITGHGCRCALSSRTMRRLQYQDLVALGRSEACLEDDPPQDRDEAYTVFTTGTAGKAKAVPVTQNALASVLLRFLDRAGLAGNSRWSWTHSPAFGFSMLEIWAPLMRGGTVVVMDSRNPEDIYHEILRRRIDIACLTPSAFAMIDAIEEAAGQGMPDVDTIILSGEAPRESSVVRWTSRHPIAPRLISTYALSETAGQVTYFELTGFRGGSIPLGEPLPGIRVFLVDEGSGSEDGALPNAYGRIAIRSPYVSDGYYTKGRRPRRRDDTPRTLVTEDMGFADERGRIMFVGRRDSVRKVLGYAVNLSEIERTAVEHRDVQDAVAVVDTENPMYVTLCVHSRRRSLTSREIRRFFRDRVPQHCVPSCVRIWEQFPLNLNAKVDRRRIAVMSQQDDTQYCTEGSLFSHAMGLLEEVTGQTADSEKGFMEHGLTSLDCAWMAARLNAMGYGLSVVDLFRFPSVRSLSESWTRPGTQVPDQVGDRWGRL